MDLPPEEAINLLKKRYKLTQNTLFMWEAVRVTNAFGIMDEEIRFFLMWTAGNVIEAARGILLDSAPPDIAKILELSVKKGETGRFRAFALEFRDAWIEFEIRRAI